LGPNYEKGLRTLGRRRLPAGVVAILDDPETLRAAIRELYAYAVHDRSKDRARRGIVFRVVNTQERHAYISKLADFFGAKNLSTREAVYGVPLGHFHIIDDSFISHVIARHSTEMSPGHLAVSVDDFTRLPEIISPARIVEFQLEKGMPRVTYERRYDDGTFWVVEEVQAHAGLSAKTMYKNK
jgi:hypothetical protein